MRMRRVLTAAGRLMFGARWAMVGTFTVLSACVHESAMSLGNDLIQINVSAAPVYGRAGAERIAYENAAKATLAAGYDKFIVVSNEGWTDQTYHSGSFSQVSASGTPALVTAQGTSSSSAFTLRHPEAKMVIRVFHANDSGADKAIDARTVLAAAGSQTSPVNPTPASAPPLTATVPNPAASSTPPQPASSTTSSPALLPTQAPGSTGDRLRALKDLLDRHLITPEEYESRRKAILDAL